VCGKDHKESGTDSSTLVELIICILCFAFAVWEDFVDLFSCFDTYVPIFIRNRGFELWHECSSSLQHLIELFLFRSCELVGVIEVAAIDNCEHHDEQHDQAVDGIGNVLEIGSLALGHVHFDYAHPWDLVNCNGLDVVVPYGIVDDPCSLVEVFVGLGVVSHREVSALLLQGIEIDADGLG